MKFAQRHAAYRQGRHINIYMEENEKLLCDKMN